MHAAGIATDRDRYMIYFHEKKNHYFSSTQKCIRVTMNTASKSIRAVYGN